MHPGSKCGTSTFALIVDILEQKEVIFKVVLEFKNDLLLEVEESKEDIKSSSAMFNDIFTRLGKIESCLSRLDPSFGGTFFGGRDRQCHSSNS